MSPEELESELLELKSETEAVEDRGFSAHVLRALPPPRANWWTRPAVLLGMTFVGCVFGLVLLPGGEFIQKVLERFWPADIALSFSVPWLLLVYVVSWMAVASAVETRRSA
jgi:hypothetical protein